MFARMKRSCLILHNYNKQQKVLDCANIASLEPPTKFFLNLQLSLSFNESPKGI
jgi:hypothetical protein